MSPAPEDRYLGEYLLKNLLSENSLARTWLAEQVSVSRRVLIDELLPDQLHQRETFLADIRAKAAVDHPLIGSVYEAVAEANLCFFAHELLPGATLEDRRIANEPFKPGRLAHLLRRISEAQLYHETAEQATSALQLKNVHVDDHGVIRLENLAIAGTRGPEQSTRDITSLGETLVALVADGQPGTTRMLTLLGWMRGEELETPITWEQVRDICSQIEQQLAEVQTSGPPTKAGKLPQKNIPSAVWVGLGVLAILGIGTVVLKQHPAPPPPAPKAVLSEEILISAGTYPTPDGTQEELRAFRIAPQEVTIGQYAEFLQTLDTLAKHERSRTFDHEDQPTEKTSHIPSDWPAVIAATKSNEPWSGRMITLDCPVTGVDWWDASAYAEWKQARLPTQEEWFAALRKDITVASELKPAGWIPVTAETPDRTPNGLIGMAGSVSEWTRRPAANPLNPLGERKWVIIGGSYLKPGSNALTREWTLDRSLRRADLGFRIVLDSN